MYLLNIKRNDLTRRRAVLSSNIFCICCNMMIVECYKCIREKVNYRVEIKKTNCNGVCSMRDQVRLYKMF